MSGTFDAAAFAHRHGGKKESRGSRSSEWLFRCPACGSSRLRWNAGKVIRRGDGSDVSGPWICWGCQRSGHVLDLVMMFEGCDIHRARKIVAEGTISLPAPTTLAHARVAERESVRMLPPIPWPLGVTTLAAGGAEVGPAWAYLAVRGVNPAAAVEWGIGFGVSGRLRRYVVFPVRMDGALVYYQGRAAWDAPVGLAGDSLREWRERTGYRKSLNPVAVEGDQSATKTEVLLGYDRARGRPHVVVVEGPFDALGVAAACPDVGVVALLGKVPSQAQIERLRRLGASRYTVYLDAGGEERKSALHLASELAAYSSAFVAEPPPGRDAGDLGAANATILAGAGQFLVGRAI